jgi:fructokinase
MSESSSSASFRPLIFGEVLFDHFPDGARVPGGAPFNVAWHLQGFKAQPLLVSAVGTDTPGEELLGRMADWRMDRRGVQLHHDRPTGRVVTELDNGNPSFRIEPNQAYDSVTLERIPPPSQLHQTQLLYHGTLAIREDISRGTLDYLRNTVQCPILVDVNLRHPWWNRDLVDWALTGVDCVKLNREEAALLIDAPVASRREQSEAANRLRERYQAKLVVMTLGAAGAIAVAGDEVVRQEAAPIRDMQDTVGAGDAFSAVLALGIDLDWPISVTLRRATEFAGDVCRHRGATQVDSSLYDLHRGRWNDE